MLVRFTQFELGAIAAALKGSPDFHQPDVEDLVDALNESQGKVNEIGGYDERQEIF